MLPLALLARRPRYCHMFYAPAATPPPLFAIFSLCLRRRHAAPAPAAIRLLPMSRSPIRFVLHMSVLAEHVDKERGSRCRRRGRYADIATSLRRRHVVCRFLRAFMPPLRCCFLAGYAATIYARWSRTCFCRRVITSYEAAVDIKSAYEERHRRHVIS